MKVFDFMEIKQQYKKYIGSNPYKGFVPFKGSYELECSMEFFYMPLNKIWISENDINWQELEENLIEIKNRNHQAIVRFFLDYPGHENGFSSFFWNEMKKIEYSEYEGGIQTNYDNQFLVKKICEFIVLFGKKYDGHLRIAFIECGLIGHWGEWHTYPQDELMPTESEEKEILRAFRKHFSKTKILFRYPKYKWLKKFNFGFHDDSFCFSTLKGKCGHFLEMMSKNYLSNVYLKNPIGGEVRPEEQKNLNSGKETSQPFLKCVKDSHVSWLLNQGAFTTNKIELVRKLSAEIGYDFYIDNICLNKKKGSFRIYNSGVAPIYYPFTCFIKIINNKNEVLKAHKLKYDIRKLKPQKSKKLYFTLKENDLNYSIVFSLENKKQVIFLSNKECIKHYALLKK